MLEPEESATIIWPWKFVRSKQTSLSESEFWKWYKTATFIHFLLRNWDFVKSTRKNFNIYLLNINNISSVIVLRDKAKTKKRWHNVFCSKHVHQYYYAFKFILLFQNIVQIFLPHWQNRIHFLGVLLLLLLCFLIFHVLGLLAN